MSSVLEQENKELKATVADLERALSRVTKKMPSLSEIVACEKQVLAKLTVNDAAEAIQFYVDAFDATELFSVKDESQRVGHAVLTIGDAMVLINSEYPDLGMLSATTLGGCSVSISLRVNSAATSLETALNAGCKQLTELEKSIWGDINCTVVDPFGQIWVIAQNVEQVSAEQILERAEQELQSDMTNVSKLKKTKAA